MATRALLLVSLFAAPAAWADELPVSIQAKLLSTMPTYVVDLAPQGAAKFKVLIVHPGTEAAPSRGAEAIAGAVGQVKIGALEPQVVFVPFGNAQKFQAALAAHAPNAVYLAPELDAASATAVADACGGAKKVTFSGVDAHVKAGVILGFSLVEARPRVLVNLKQATKQGVAFQRGLLSHSVVVDR